MKDSSGTYLRPGLARASYGRKAILGGLLCAVAGAAILAMEFPFPVAQAAPAPPPAHPVTHWVLSDSEGHSFTFQEVQMTANSFPPQVTLSGGRPDPNLYAWQRSSAERGDSRDCVLAGDDARGVAEVRYKLTKARITRLEYFSQSQTDTVTLMAESITRTA